MTITNRVFRQSIIRIHNTLENTVDAGGSIRVTFPASKAAFRQVVVTMNLMKTTGCIDSKVINTMEGRVKVKAHVTGAEIYTFLKRI